LEPLEIDFYIRVELNRDRILGVLDIQDLERPLENALGEQESSREFRIMSGRSHSDGDGLIAQTNFEGFFDG
jgi:hypothetical protein